MSSESVKLDHYCYINPEVITKKYPFQLIRYYDISSVNTGFLNEPPKRYSLTESPSRAKRILRSGDIIISTVRPNRRSFLYLKAVEEGDIASTGFAILRAKQNVDSRFIYYLISEQKFTDYLVSHATGSAYPAVSPESIMNAPVPLLNYAKQKTIADILSSLDDKIELNRQMCKTLEDVVSTLFKSWFIDFDPVNAKAAGREPEGLSPEISELFPDSFIDSSLGLIPSSWKIKKLGDVSQIDNGFAFKSQDYRENGIYILRTKNFSDDGYVVRLKDDVFLNINLLDDYKKFLCKPFDYHLVMVGNSIGKTAYILPHQLPALRNQNMWCFRPKTENLPRFYLNLTIDYKVKSVMGWASGSARSFFRKSDFQIFDILWPSNETQVVFEDVSSNLYKKISNLNNQNSVLIELRDLLLPKLINGEVKIQEADTLILATI